MPKLFGKRNATSAVHSVPVTDEVAATLPQTTRLPLTSAFDAWTEPEGELALDVYVTPTTVVVRSAVAGVNPEALSISLHNDLLTIRGRRHDEAQIDRSDYVVQECHWGSFSRSVVLPEAVAPDSAEAVLKNGVLTVSLRRAVPVPVSIRLIEA